MGLGDRIRGWFKGEGKQKAPSPATSPASKAAIKEIEAFIRSRPGVEGFVEPKTAIYSTTLLLVAADGEYLRRPIRDRVQALDVCSKNEIPLYDAAKVGYPKRMRDYDAGIRRQTVSLEELPPWPGEGGAGGKSGEGGEADGDASGTEGTGGDQAPEA